MIGYLAARAIAIRQFEQAYFDVLLRQHHGNLTSAAREAGVSRSTFYRLVRRHGLSAGEYRSRLSAVAPLREPESRENRDHHHGGFVESRR